MATYDVLSIYPEGKPCECCGQKIKDKFFITIFGRTVCSINCKNRLKSIPEDSCYICKRPVWEGFCYATKTKFLCSDKCKNEFLNLRESRILVSKCPIHSKMNQFKFPPIDEYLVSLKVNYGHPFLPNIKH